MKKKHDHSWKSLPQKPRWTWQRVRRCLLHAGVVCSLVSVIGFGLWRMVGKSKTVQPLERILFSTNGVLRQAWFLSNVRIPFGDGLMAIDLEDLRHRCLQCGQIEAVDITREFPDALCIRLRERQACAKLLLYKNGRRRIGLVSEEGAVFEPTGYSKQQLRDYPTLSDIPKTLMKDGKITGFSSVFRLLQFLKMHAPDVFQAVRQVSLRHFDPFLEQKRQTVELSIGGAWTLIFPMYQPEIALSKLRSILRALSLQQRKNLRRLNVASTRPTVEFL